MTAFSERPGRERAILVQAFPHFACASARTRSSSSVHSPFFKAGS
ncbi:hypothetical protein NGA_2066900, partial [Nannochloropsis gaditana CCMP526]